MLLEHDRQLMRSTCRVQHPAGCGQNYPSIATFVRGMPVVCPTDLKRGWPAARVR